MWESQREIEMKKDIRRALQFIHKRAVNSGGKDLHPQGICFNLQMLIGDADYTRFIQDREDIYKGYKDYSGISSYPIKSAVAGESPVEYYLSQCGKGRRWKGEQLQKRIELLEVMIQFYAPKKRVKKDVWYSFLRNFVQWSSLHLVLEQW